MMRGATVVAAACCTILGTTRSRHPSEAGHCAGSFCHERGGGGRLIEGSAHRPPAATSMGDRSARVATSSIPMGANAAGRPVLRGVLSGALDMDKLDYLPRDAGPATCRTAA